MSAPAPTPRPGRRRSSAIGRQAAEACGLGLLAGIPAGVASYLFLEALDAAIGLREDRLPWLIWLLPPAAFALGAAYHHLGGRSGGGTALVMAQADSPDTMGVPGRMAPLALAGAVLAHLFGASVGREGVALQMAGSLADGAGRLLHLDRARRSMLLHAALSGGFGSVFGVPWAALVFAFEVRRRRPDPATLAAVAIAALSGHAVVGLLGHDHARYPRLAVALSAGLLAKAVLTGLACGACATMFVRAVAIVRRQLGRIGHPPARAAVAGLVVAVGAAGLGREYLSLSLPLAFRSLDGQAPVEFAWLAKLCFTAVSIGGGIPGGEVTPLFVTGATLGAALGSLLDAPVALFAGLGFVAVFAAAAKVPLACTVMFAELFGPRAVVVAAAVCLAANLVTGGPAIYPPPMGLQRGEAGSRPPGT